MPRYILYSMIAVALSFGTSLETDGPGDSAFMSCRLCSPPAKGKMARINTRTPMPPTQWEKLRQSNMHLDMASTSGRILAPVVVNPEMISNTASTNEGISPLKTKGRQPIILITIQPRATDI